MTEKLHGQNDLLTAFRQQADACRSLGSPFVGRICGLFAVRLQPKGAVAKKLFNWQGDVSGTGASLPLRMAGTLHALVLEGRCKDLSALFPPSPVGHDNDVLWSAISSAMADHADFFRARLESAPQTNEVRRAAALLPGFLTIAALSGLPLALSEIGASAGLNLFWDRFGYRLGKLEWGDKQSPVQLAPDWTGRPPPHAELDIRDRAGCDLAPLDPASKSDRLRLLSYIWADQTDRIVRANAALDIAAKEQLRVEKADALDWLEKKLAQVYEDTVHVLYHTIVWQYLSPEARENGEAMIFAAGQRATDKSPLAWLRLETDGAQPGAALTLTLWPSDEERCLARADYHGRWVNWFGWKS